MTFKAYLLAISGCAFFAAAPAYAGELGSSSSGVMQIQVIIPPLGDAVAAAADGAEGLWTVESGKDGLMMNAPDTIGSDGFSVTLFSEHASALRILSIAGMKSVSSQDGGFVPAQMERRRFSFVRQDGAYPTDPATFTIGTV